MGERVIESKKKFLLCAVGCVALLVISSAQAVPYSIEPFTQNGLYFNSSELDIFVDVQPGTDSLVEFTFHNQSSISSYIAEIYFDADSLLSYVGITGSSGAGVSFVEQAKPASLPGGKTLNPVFAVSEGFSFDATPPAPHNGIGQQEWLTVTFGLNSGTFGDLLTWLDSGEVRIGTHVIGLPDGSSESGTTVPEPATIILLGLSSLALLRRRN